MSSSALTRVICQFANALSPTLTVPAVSVAATTTIQSYTPLNYTPRCPAGPRLPWPGLYAHIRSTHTRVPCGIAYRIVGIAFGPWRQARAFVCGRVLQLKKTQYPPRPKVLEDDIEENFVKGSGPGGQKINKTNSAVQLRHIPTGIVVKSQATRSREQNRKLARRLLAEKLEDLEKGDESRTAVMRGEKSKRKKSKEKKAKRKYAKLAAEKTQTSDDGPAGDSSDRCDTKSNPESSPVNDRLAGGPDI